MNKIMPKHENLIDHMFESLHHDEDRESMVKLLKKVSKRIVV